MDRRAALKKLGVGGAVAISAPVILQSYAVAAGASQMPTVGEVGAATSSSTSDNKTLNIIISPNPFPPETTYFWNDTGGGSTSVTFSSTTVLAPSVTVSTGNLGSKTFTLNLRATHPRGDFVDYTFSWSGSLTVS